MKNVYWLNFIFLSVTLLTTLFGVPIYLWHYGISFFQVALFLAFFIATGLSITLGYHRLFSHITFQAAWPVRLFTLLFGAAAFEDSALIWCADHRRHHKFAGHDEDPYDIRKGFWHAHIGWILFRQGPETPLTWVRDLQKDPLLRWQHRYYKWIGLSVGLVLPTLIGYLYGGGEAAFGAFLIAGIARVCFVHHMTFCINSLCHWTGRRPYASDSSARDSFLMAMFTFGEGYHNFHHKFQHDYRNGIKAWHWDPTKWTIRVLQMVGLVKNLRRVDSAKIMQAVLLEQERTLVQKLAVLPSEQHGYFANMLLETKLSVENAILHWSAVKDEYQAARRARGSNRGMVSELRSKLTNAKEQLSESLEIWREACASLAKELPA